MWKHFYNIKKGSCSQSHVNHSGLLVSLLSMREAEWLSLTLDMIIVLFDKDILVF
jgi:hypothetical protein